MFYRFKDGEFMADVSAGMEYNIFEGKLDSLVRNIIKEKYPDLTEETERDLLEKTKSEFIKTSGDGLKLIAYCFEDERFPRRSIKEVLQAYEGTDITVLIGPEGDFSHEEAELAFENGFIPVHLGDSRLRTETAALSAVAAAYFRYM